MTPAATATPELPSPEKRKKCFNKKYRTRNKELNLDKQIVVYAN